MTEKYVPQVGHLVKVQGKQGKNTLLIMSIHEYSLKGIDHKGDKYEYVLSHSQFTFIACRSSEWQALFQLDTPTP